VGCFAERRIMVQATQQMLCYTCWTLQYP
jgi:hypothetical protein